MSDQNGIKWHTQAKVCEPNMCCGCKLCENICPKNAITVSDDMSAMNAIIDMNRCVGCNRCHNLCPQNNPPQRKEPFEWFQGWAETDVRSNSSSGGFATAISRQFILEGGVVFSCKLKDGDFKYAAAETLDGLKGFSGSKYVKSNPGNVYPLVKEKLQTGKKVLFIGLPCHVAALINYIGNKYKDALYTVDLICHGSPSVKILDKALKEYGFALNNLEEVTFRRNNRFDVEKELRPIVPVNTWDRYTMGFLNGTFYTHNCYSCQYASTQRISDVTLGDSWGTKLADEECKGVSLALCQTEKGKMLFEKSGLQLYDVDIGVAIENNEQLNHAFIMPENREVFFASFGKSKSFKKAMFKAFPQKCMRQSIKGVLVGLNIWNILNKYFIRLKREGNTYQISVKIKR